MMKTKTLLYIITIILTYYASIFSQDETYYFYHGLNYGSQSCYNPATLIINGGFGIMQISNRSTNLSSINFKAGWNNVYDNISHPIREIKAYGVQKFIFGEVFPGNLKVKNAQWFPNYQLHMLGGGMTYRGMYEWYHFHNFKYPKMFALFSWTAYHTVNEVVENNRFEGNNVDVIADMLIFNPLGVLLFSFDSVSRFLSHVLNLSDWSFQPVYSPSTRTIENNGQNFCMKYAIPGSEKWSIFYFFGVHGTLGLSYKAVNGKSFSFGAGIKAKDLITTNYNNNTRSMTTSFIWTAGLFYDRNNSLLASLILAGTKGYRARLNIYPGLIKYGFITPGLFCAISEDEQLISGISFNFLPFGYAGFLSFR